MIALRALPLVLCLWATAGVAEWPYEDDADVRQGRTAVQAGPRSGYDYDGDAFSAGVQLRLPLWRRSHFALVPSGDIYLGGRRADWQANVDLQMTPGPRGGLYAGLGLGWVDTGGRRERAVNQVIGLQVPLGRGPLRAYVEGRWTELDRTTVFRLVAGINMSLLQY